MVMYGLPYKQKGEVNMALKDSAKNTVTYTQKELRALKRQTKLFLENEALKRTETKSADEFSEFEKTTFGKKVKSQWKKSPSVPFPFAYKYLFDFNTERWLKNGKYIPSGIKHGKIPLIENFSRKQELPLVFLGCGIRVGDFDDLPPEFSDWSTFRNQIRDLLGEGFLVTTSPSGKCKVFLKSESLQPLMSKLPTHWKVDKNSNTERVCFFTAEMVRQFTAWYPTAVFQTTEGTEPAQPTVKKNHKYRNLFPKQKLSHAGSVKFKRRTQYHTSKFIEFFFTVMSLFTRSDTFAISQEVLARTLDIDRATVAKWLKQMVADGVIKPVAEHIDWKRGTTYQIQPAFKFWLKRALPRKKINSVLVDGKRYRYNVWFAYSVAGLNDEQIEQRMNVIPGIDEPGNGGTNRRKELWSFIRYARTKVA